MDSMLAIAWSFVRTGLDDPNAIVPGDGSDQRAGQQIQLVDADLISVRHAILELPEKHPSSLVGLHVVELRVPLDETIEGMVGDHEATRHIPLDGTV
jgi:hypothetical protein